MSVRRAFDTFRGYRHPEFNIIQRRRRWFVLSGSAILVSIIALVFLGLNYSIDFTGGTLIEYRLSNDVTVEQVRDLLGQDPYAREGAEVQIVGGDQVSIRTSALTDLTAGERTQLFEALAEQAGISPDDISVQVVGPTWGADLPAGGDRAGRRPARDHALHHAPVRMEDGRRRDGRHGARRPDHGRCLRAYRTRGVAPDGHRDPHDPRVSLYDTVVIFDKVKENTESTALLGKDTYEGVANYSMNQVLMRSVNTSLVVVLPILSLLLFGGDTLKDFAFAMLVSVVTGAYSSIFVATPILVVLKEREPKYQQLRARLESRQGDRRLRAVPTPVGRPRRRSRRRLRPSSPRREARSGPGRPRRARAKSKRRPPAKRRRR